MSTTIAPEAPAAVAPTKKRNHKPLYPLAEGTTVEKTPDDFQYGVQRMLQAQFIDSACFAEHRADVLDWQARELREKAEQIRLAPPKETTKKAVLLTRLGKLEAKLQELGVNLDDLFAEDEE